MTLLRRTRGQKFLAERLKGTWSFPCEVISVTPDQMVLKQCILEGIDEDFLEPDLKDIEIRIFLEPEIMEFVYV